MPTSIIHSTTSAEYVKHRKELYAVCVSLSVLGLSFSSWASRVPDIRDATFLTAATLGYALMMRGIGTVTMMPIVAISINKFGAKKTALATGLVVASSLVPITLVNNWFSLGFLLMIVGACSSSYNISVNALGSIVETETGKSHMSKIHSWFGIGNLAGAVFGTFMVRFDVDPTLHFSMITLIIFIIIGTTYRYLPEDAPTPDTIKARFKWPHGGLIAIGIICFLAATIESSINNWVNLFFTDHIKVMEGYEAVGYTVFAGSLLGMRIIGDRLKTTFGARNLLITGSLSAAFGIGIAIIAPNMIIAIIGVFIAGAGVALNFPMLFSAAGKEGAIALTTVATFGSVAGMVSQPIMGAIVERFELTGGFLFLAICMVIVAFLASKARLLRA